MARKYMCMAVPLCQILPIGVRFLLSDTSRERRDSINTATKHVSTIRCMALPWLRLFFIQVYDAKLFIGPINELECPTQMARKSFSLVLFGNDLLAWPKMGTCIPWRCTVPLLGANPDGYIISNGGEFSIALFRAFYLKCLFHRHFTTDQRTSKCLQ
jgi:hypothetical protein